ncbi:MAG: hypothetical protein ACD_5C00080G0002 [uncultured bacterium]|nr:MAG: hypothetical protein ACD_5C00080G0002 [uncultured bacterium]
MGKYLHVSINSIKKNFVYRANIFITMISILLSFVALFYFWTSIYKQGNQIGNYSMEEIITYYVFVTIFQLMITGDNIAWSVGEEIRMGQINMNVLRPVNYLFYKLSQSLGNLFYRFMVFTPVILVFLWMLGDYFQKIQNSNIYLIFILSALVSYILYFILYFLVGVAAFWTGESGSFFFVCWVIINFMQGAMIPLDLLPGWFESISNILPFKYLFFIPISLVTGRIQFEYSYIYIPFAWVVVTYFLAQFIYKKGLKKYEGFGI